MTATPPLALKLERARGELDLAFACTDRGTEPRAVRQSGCSRVRFPRRINEGVLEGVCLNTAGGLAGGDALGVRVACSEGARARLTSTAAEKVYRALDEPAEMSVHLRLRAGATFEWLPQETILFDGGKLRRRIEVEMDETASLLAVEAVVLGRTARGEVVRHGLIEDSWNVRRGGKLVFADRLRLGGPVHEHARGLAVLAGAAAFATVLLVDRQAQGRLDDVRAALEAEAPGSSGGASAWNGLSLVRLVGQDGAALRRALTAVLAALRGRSLPRVWTI